MGLKVSRLERDAIRLKLASEKASERMRLARSALQQAGTCSHPREFWYEHTRDSDDGYGHWYKFNCRSCQLCLAVDDYADGRWRMPKSHLR
jgi:hypothetical protein